MSFNVATNTVIIDFPGSDAYEAFEYPAGESQVRLNKDFLEPIRVAEEIIIVAKVASALDLVRLILLSDAIYGWCLKRQTLRIAYLPYARADRRFVHGDCAGLQTFGRILDAGHFESVVAQDVHSDRAVDYVRNLTWNAAWNNIEAALADIDTNFGPGTILLPDEGAVRRYPHGFSWPILHCSKKRDAASGKLLGFELPSGIPAGPVLIVDDICDGGGTFVGIAEELGARHPLYLYVTHGIFSKGYGTLGDLFQRIYTTESVKPMEPYPENGLVKVLR